VVSKKEIMRTYVPVILLIVGLLINYNIASTTLVIGDFPAEIPLYFNLPMRFTQDYLVTDIGSGNSVLIQHEGFSWGVGFAATSNSTSFIHIELSGPDIYAIIVWIASMIIYYLAYRLISSRYDFVKIIVAIILILSLISLYYYNSYYSIPMVRAYNIIRFKPITVVNTTQTTMYIVDQGLTSDSLIYISTSVPVNIILAYGPNLEHSKVLAVATTQYGGYLKAVEPHSVLVIQTLKGLKPSLVYHRVYFVFIHGPNSFVFITPVLMLIAALAVVSVYSRLSRKIQSEPAEGRSEETKSKIRPQQSGEGSSGSISSQRNT